MARKRMISPEIWESQSFGELSMLAKILFIGMISQADDDGKGVLSAQLLKSRILPYDEMRIADIDKALREIGHKPSVYTDGDKAREEAGHKLSVTYYEVSGKRYYCFDNWHKWQTINRPIPSKLPNPPVADGEGEGLHSHEEITNNSMSTHAQLSECSRQIEDIKEENRKEPPIIPPDGGKGGVGDKKLFFNTYPALAAFKGRYDDSAVEYSVLLDRFSKSERLRKTYSMKWVCENYVAIKDGLFADKPEAASHQEDLRVAWERWNYDRKHVAEEKAEQALKRATSDKAYSIIRKELNKLSIELAFAEIKDKLKAAEITKRIEDLELQGDERLKELGIDKAQFTPQYSCTCCNDTGYTQQGTICKDCLKEFEEKTK